MSFNDIREILSNQELLSRAMTDIFTEIDTDKDGVINANEIISGIKIFCSDIGLCEAKNSDLIEILSMFFDDDLLEKVSIGEFEILVKFIINYLTIA